MPRYDVTLKEIEIYKIEGFEAKDECEARDKAWDILTDNNNAKQKYHEDSDGESEACEL